MSRRFGVGLLVVVMLLLGCEDNKAQPFFEQGRAAEADGKLKGAKNAYEEAVEADGESDYGKKAADRLKIVDEALKKEEATKKAEAEAEAEAAAERRKLLKSDDPEDWRTLQKKFPNSHAAKTAAEMLAQNASICGDLDRWVKLIDDETEALSQVVPRYKKKNLLADGALDLVKNSSEMKKECVRHQNSTKQASERVEKHGIKDGEEDIRRSLATSVLHVSIVWKKFATSFAAGTKGLTDLMKYHLYVKEDFVPEMTAAVAQVKADCSALAGKADAANETGKDEATNDDCLPCSSQEDFDAAMKKGSKCCPVIGCRSDADCSGGRVCCKIPDGQLCGDVHRCAASDRVR